MDDEEEFYTPKDIRNMTMEEYTKAREHLFHEIGGIPLEELAKTETIRKPRKPFHFESF